MTVGRFHGAGVGRHRRERTVAGGLPGPGGAWYLSDEGRGGLRAEREKALGTGGSGDRRALPRRAGADKHWRERAVAGGLPGPGGA